MSPNKMSTNYFVRLSLLSFFMRSGIAAIRFLKLATLFSLNKLKNRSVCNIPSFGRCFYCVGMGCWHLPRRQIIYGSRIFCNVAWPIVFFEFETREAVMSSSNCYEKYKQQITFSKIQPIRIERPCWNLRILGLFSLSITKIKLVRATFNISKIILNGTACKHQWFTKY